MTSKSLVKPEFLQRYYLSYDEKRKQGFEVWFYDGTYHMQNVRNLSDKELKRKREMEMWGDEKK